MDKKPRRGVRPEPRHEDKTSWGKVAGWYGKHLKEEDTYHGEVVFPNTLRMLGLSEGERVLDVACGEGSFAPYVVGARSSYVGVDIAAALLQQARNKNIRQAEFLAGNAKELHRTTSPKTFSAATCILALQNIDDLGAVFQGVARALMAGGRLVIVLTHPAFRVPRQSGWGFDDGRSLQYRRVDAYMSSNEVQVLLNPSRGSHSVKTYTYHRPLQIYIQALAEAGFMVDGLEEWISHRESTSGPRAKAENRARREIPLFMAIRARLR
jgi:SAM-dependent methyltransferase